MLKVKVNDVSISEKEEKNGKVPMTLNYSLSIDYDIYLSKIKALEQVFENLGAVFHKRVDIPAMMKNNSIMFDTVQNRSKIKKLSTTNICIIKKYGQGYKTDFWEFPVSLSKNYPFNRGRDHDRIVLNKYVNTTLEVTGKKSVLFAKIIETPKSTIRMSVNSHYYRAGWTFNPNNTNIPCLSFLLDTVHEYINIKTKVKLPISIIGSIKNISIELEKN